MTIFITTLHIMLCIALILVILLQPGKDGAAAFGGGGGGNQMYGPRGQGTILTRATTTVAGMFMVTSITLAWFSNDKVQSGGDIEDQFEEIEKENFKRASATRAVLDLQPDIKAPDTEPVMPVEAPAPPPPPEGAATDAPAAEVPAAEVPAAEVPGVEVPAGDAAAPTEATPTP